MGRLTKVCIAGFVVIVLAVTNPSKPEFTVWANQQVQNHSGNALANGFMSLFGNSLINSVTTQQNLVLFSIFTSDIGSGKKIVTIGLLHNFIPLQVPKTTGLSQ